MPDDFQLTGDEQFEQRWYRTEQVIFALMTLFVLSGLAGLFGGGWLSKTVSSLQAGRGSVEYERFLRNQGRTELTINTPSSAGSSETVRLDREFLEHAQVMSTSPVPTQMRSEGDGVTYTFASDPARPARLLFQLTPQGLGPFSAAVAVNGSAVRINSFIFP